MAHVKVDATQGHPSRRTKTPDWGDGRLGSFASAFRAEDNEHRRQFRVIYLAADPVIIRGAMKSVAQTGVASLLIFRNVFVERIELLGITDRLNELRRGL